MIAQGEWDLERYWRNCESELVIDSRISSPGQCGVRRSGTAVWKGELEGTGGLPCGAKDKAKTQKETESLLLSIKQLHQVSLVQSIKFGLKVNISPLLFKSV